MQRAVTGGSKWNRTLVAPKQRQARDRRNRPCLLGPRRADHVSYHGRGNRRRALHGGDFCLTGWRHDGTHPQPREDESFHLLGRHAHRFRWAGIQSLHRPAILFIIPAESLIRSTTPETSVRRPRSQPRRRALALFANVFEPVADCSAPPASKELIGRCARGCSQVRSGATPPGITVPSESTETRRRFPCHGHLPVYGSILPTKRSVWDRSRCVSSLPVRTRPAGSRFLRWLSPPHGHDHYEETVYGHRGCVPVDRGRQVDQRWTRQALCIPRGAVHTVRPLVVRRTGQNWWRSCAAWPDACSALRRLLG